MVIHLWGWCDAYQGVLGAGLYNLVSCSALTGIAGTVAVASGRRTLFRVSVHPQAFPESSANST